MTLKEGKLCVYLFLHLRVAIEQTETTQGPQISYKIMAYGVLAAIRGLTLKTR